MWQREGKRQRKRSEAGGHGSGLDGQAKFTDQTPSSVIQGSAEDLQPGCASGLEIRELLKEMRARRGLRRPLATGHLRRPKLGQI